MRGQREPERPRVPRWKLIVALALGLLAALLVTASVQGRGGPAVAVPAGPFVGSDVVARIDAAEDAFAEGQVTFAVQTLRKFAHERAGTPLGRREAAWLRWIAGAMGATPGADVNVRPTGDEWLELSNAPAHVPLLPGGVRISIDNDEDLRRRILERIEPAVVDVDDPLHDLALAQVQFLAGQAQMVEQIVGWLLAPGPDGEARGDVGVMAVVFGDPTGVPARTKTLWTRTVALSQRDLCDALLVAATDERRSADARWAAAAWLGDTADLPLGLGSHHFDGIARDSLPIAEIIAAWPEVRDLARVPAHLARVRMAVDELDLAVDRNVWGPFTDLPKDEQRRLAPRSDRNQVAFWILRHTGVDVHRAAGAALDPWLAADADPERLLRDALLVEPSATAEDVLALMHSDRQAQPALETLLALMAPDDVVPPLVGARTAWEPGAISRWRQALGVDPAALSLRAAHLAFERGRWTVVPESERRAQLSGGLPAKFSMGRDLDAPGDVWARVVVPGMSLAVEPGARHRVGMTVGIERTEADEGDRIRFGVSRSVRRASGNSHSSLSGRDVTLPFAFSPDIDVGATRVPDWFRNDLVLVRVVAGDDEGGADLTLDDWHRVIAIDLDRLADLAEDADPAYEFHNTHQNTLTNLCGVAMAVRVPEALPALLRLRATMPNWGERDTGDLVDLAVVMAGGHSALGADELDRLAAGTELTSFVNGAMGPGPRYWLRVLLQTDDASLRDLATSVVVREGLSEDLATDLAAALEAGTVRPTPGILSALAAAPPVAITTADQLREHAALATACALVNALLVFLALVLLVAGARRATSLGLRAAGALVVGGVVVTAVDATVGGFPLLPTSLAIGLASLGALRLTLAVPRSRGGWVATVCFAAAAALVGIEPWAAGAAEFVGVVGAALLGHALFEAVPARDDTLPRRPARGVSVRLLLVVMPVGLTCVFAVLAALRFAGVVSFATLTTVAVVTFAMWTVLAVAPSLLARSEGRRRDPLPRAFLACYVVPLGLTHVWAAVLLLKPGTLTIRLGQPWVGMILTAAGLAVAWCLLFRLLDGAVALARAHRPDQP